MGTEQNCRHGNADTGTCEVNDYSLLQADSRLQKSKAISKVEHVWDEDDVVEGASESHAKNQHPVPGTSLLQKKATVSQSGHSLDDDEDKSLGASDEAQQVFDELKAGATGTTSSADQQQQEEDDDNNDNNNNNNNNNNNDNNNEHEENEENEENEGN